MSPTKTPKKSVSENLTQPDNETPHSAKEWMRLMMAYRQPKLHRSLFEIGVTFLPFITLCVLSYFALNISVFLSFGLSLLAAGFLVRLFIIQHDCSHGAFFKQKKLNEWVGRVIGVVTMTPFSIWKRAHLTHHASSGNLEKRGIGDIHMLTVEEYKASSPKARFFYRLYRHPLVMFLIGPIYIFLIAQRLPDKFLRKEPKYWFSAMGTNLFIVAVVGALIYFVGWKAYLLVYIPMVVVAGAIGVWMFFVQHQFEDTVWDSGDKWDRNGAAIFGSSHYDLPKPLRWITGNIGIHHVHHLNSRIPFYRLTEALRDHPKLVNVKRLTMAQSLRCVKLKLWCEEKRKLVTIKAAMAT
jgi:acyl-lipid omega-6 desaturase (Delta-12 desaturase)